MKVKINLGARRRLLMFFGGASERSCRSYPLWDRHLWQSSIRRALSTARRNHWGSIRLHVPIDASVDVTDAGSRGGTAGRAVPQMGRLAKIARLRDMRNREMREWGTPRQLDVPRRA